VCVFLGIAAAAYDLRSLNVLHLSLAFLGALLAHISVNVLNDYFDYRSGIDLKVKRTPFSGGSGILPAGLLNPRSVYVLGTGCLLAVALIGIYFLYEYSLGILPVGILGILVVYFYTTHLTKNPILCIIAPGLFALMVLGTYFTQAGEYTLAVIATLVPGILISNLLLLNQFPDVEADRAGSRYHLPIAIGRRNSAKVYIGLLLAAYLCLIFPVAFGILPVTALLGLATLPLGFKAVKGVFRHYDDIDNLIPFMATNIQITLLTPLLMGIGIFIGLLLF
jgi:1,4-dihydroxy-2-naphthoate octaprenyltransferase